MSSAFLTISAISRSSHVQSTFWLLRLMLLWFLVLAFNLSFAFAQDMGDSPFPPQVTPGQNTIQDLPQNTYDNDENRSSRLTGDAIPRSPGTSAPNNGASNMSFISSSTFTDEPTHEPLRITPDRSEIISFSNDIGSVIFPHGEHINIIPDSQRRIVIVPYRPGSTFFTVLDESGNIMMQRHVIVATPKQNYVKIRRSCAPDAIGCETTSVYFCDGMCHEMHIPSGSSGTAQEGGVQGDAGMAQSQAAAGAAAISNPAGGAITY